MTDLVRDPDGPPERPRNRYTVRTWGDLRAGDVVNVKGRPTTIVRVEDHPIPYDVEEYLDRFNREQTESGKLDGSGKPVPDKTILDLIGHHEWNRIVEDPRQVVCFTGKHRAFPPQPIYGKFGYQFLVALGPDAHYEVCGRCGDLWPCAHTQMEHETERILDDDAKACGHCGHRVTGMEVKVATVLNGHPREVVYHGRKGPCLNAAMRLDPSVVDQRAEIARSWGVRP